jgi:uncharacterized membrane protein
MIRLGFAVVLAGFMLGIALEEGNDWMAMLAVVMILVPLEMVVSRVEASRRVRVEQEEGGSRWM